HSRSPYDSRDTLRPVTNTLSVHDALPILNDPPVATDDKATVAEDGVLKGTSVLANDSDLHGGAPSENNTPLTAQLGGDGAAPGTLPLNPHGNSTHHPAARCNAPVSLTHPP